MPAFKLATWACSRSQSRRNGVLGRAGKLDRNPGGDNAFEFHANLVDTNGGASLVIDTNDGVRVDILGLANKFTQNEFPPIVLERGAVFGMPGGGSLYPPMA